MRSVMPADPLSDLSLDEIEARAVPLLDPGVLAYYAGGAGEERTVADNRAAWGRRRPVPRVLTGTGTASTRGELLGAPLELPVLAAPTALHAIAHPGGEAATARACAAAGTVMVLSMMGSARPAAIARAAPEGRRWLQLYVLRDRGATDALVDEAVAHGFEALVVTVDTPIMGMRPREERSPFALPPGVEQPVVGDAAARTGVAPERFFADLVDPALGWDDLEALVARAPLPVLVKGIHHPDDARRAVDAGAAGVIVSNHGGRQLDGVPATADLLGPAVAAVGGRVPVLVDGGIRRGIDVCVALALGADAVLVGRPVLYGLAAGGQAGVEAVLDRLRRELAGALVLLGCGDLAAARGITLWS
jgi:isopentenyl diphosphate isomerase/L-lactate dehydrogenase-like FMN-dependent dehydrogenase